MRSRELLCASVLILLVSSSCTKGSTERKLLFVDVAPQLGLRRPLRSGGTQKHWILENVGTGCALLDANQDGLLDVFVANAGVVEQGRILPGPGPALYMQGPPGKFTDRTEAAGLLSKAWQSGVAVGDMDNDGDADLFVSCFGRCLLFRNKGDGAFEEVAEAMGIEGAMFAASAVFFEFDRDGFLDLYVTGYVKFAPSALSNGGRPCLLNGVEVACGPGHFDPEPDRLYRNVNGKRFVDVTRELGIAASEGGYGLGVVAGDFDVDGWPDVYVANDTTANHLWHNIRGQRFEDVALWAGVALSDSGQGQAGMGVDTADVDGDGRLDYVVSNYSEEYNTFYRNLGEGLFEDRTLAAGLADDSYALLGWGVKFADLDNDGDLDFVVANGHVHPQVHDANPALDYLQRCLVYLNDGRGAFQEVGRDLGEATARPRAHRGMAVGDVDSDGDIDLLLTVLDGPPVLLENRSSGVGAWVSLLLEGSSSNRDAIGARVVLSAGGREQFREVTRGGSYLSAHDVRLHFGLGSASRVDSVSITWPGGTLETIGPLGGNRHYRIVEGSRKALKIPGGG